jgi:hypothetical protein
MSWRSVQLGATNCDQDNIILKLFGSQPVKYVGHDLEFSNFLNLDDQAENLVLIINQSMWCSELISLCKTQLTDPIKIFYIGINRYCIKGNDTVFDIAISKDKGKDLINFVDSQVQLSGYSTKELGHFDQDLGRYFNFVQPLTWLYGNKTTNQSNQTE